MQARRQISSQNPWLHRRLSVVLLLGLLAVVFVTLIYNAMIFKQQLTETRAASSDSRVWSVVQIEVDHQSLLLALARVEQARQLGALVDGAEDGIPRYALRDVSGAFDILYSRIDIVLSALENAEAPPELLDDLYDIRNIRDELADQIDTVGLSNVAEYDAFSDRVMALSDDIREIALGALSHFVAEAKDSRAQEGLIATRFLTISVVLVAILGAAMVIAFQLRRQLIDQIRLMTEANDNIRMVYEASMMGVIGTDMDGEILFFNSAAEDMFGYKQDAVKGRNIADTIIPPRMVGPHIAGMSRYKLTGEPKMVDRGPIHITAMRADSSEFEIELSIKANTDFIDKKILIAFVRDVSEQVAHEADLRAARDKARRHAAAKTMFLATMSHEMRTPLHGLLASLDLVDDRAVDDNTRSLLKTARDCGMRSLLQINDVLQLTSFDEIREAETVFSPGRAVSSILSELRALAKDQGNQLNMSVDSAAAEGLWLGMPETFSRVLYNLIGNALKFTKNGWVSVTLHFEGSEGGPRQLVVSVEDTGVGIDPADQLRIFTPFVVGHDAEEMAASSSHAPRSTGLGLPIAQLGVERMGGVLEVESEVGKGSRFFFSIPLNEATEESEARPLKLLSLAKPATYNFNLDVLVVDDNIVNREMTAKMVEKLGCTATIAADGVEAVALAEDQCFDVIFMDLNMPRLNGWEACYQIRQEGLSKHAKLVALTADITVQNAGREGDDGSVDMILHKPASFCDFSNALAFLTGEDGGEEGEEPSLQSMEETNPALDFSSLVGLLGRVRARKLLLGTLDDIDNALASIRHPRPDTADILHHAIGSTSVIGLSEISVKLRSAENLARAEDMRALARCREDLELEALAAKDAVMDGLSHYES